MAGTQGETTCIAYVDPVQGKGELSEFFLVWRVEHANRPEQQAEAIATIFRSLLTIGGIQVIDPIRREDGAHYVHFAVGCGLESAPHDTQIRFSEVDHRIDVYCRHHEGSWRSAVNHTFIEIIRFFGWTSRRVVVYTL